MGLDRLYHPDLPVPTRGCREEVKWRKVVVLTISRVRSSCLDREEGVKVPCTKSDDASVDAGSKGIFQQSAGLPRQFHQDVERLVW